MHDSRNFGLDLVRAVAIGLVLLAHFTNGLPSLGSYGVELFFTLSGFLIGGLLLKTIESKACFHFGDLCEFLRRRWYRTLPNYYLFLAVYLVVTLTVSAADPSWCFFGVPDSEQLTWWGKARYFAFLQNFAWPMPKYFEHSWSLSVEEWFYVLTAGTLFLMIRLFPATPRGRVQAFCLTAGTFIAIPLALRYSLPGGPDLGERKIVVLRLDAIMYGVLMAAARMYLPGLWRRAGVLALAGVAAVSAAVFSGWRSPVSPAWISTAVPLGFSLLLPLCVALPSPGGRVARWIERLSIWSYSIYLCHLLIYAGLMPVVGYEALGTAGKLAYKATALGLVLLASAANYRFFEKPITDLRDRRRKGGGEPRRSLAG
jgi:peptidoglycan/LPS O-acetylase OafA/YrhL